MDVIRFAILGLGIGAVYAFLGQGLVLIYRGSGILNFAQASVGCVGAYVFYDLRDDYGWAGPFAFIIALLVSAGISAGFQIIVLRRLRGASPLVRLVSTLALFALLTGLMEQFWASSSGIRIVVSPLPSTTLTPFSGVTITEDRLWLLGIAIVTTIVLWAFYGRTRFGLATSAVAENPTSTASLGISPDRIAALNWAMGGALAGAACIFIAPITGLDPLILGGLIVPALAAAVIGGFSSFPLTLLGGIAIGVIESELSRYVTSPTGIPTAVPFVVIAVVLIARGRNLPLRGNVADRLPRLGSGEPRWGVIAIATVSVFLSMQFLFDANWIAAISFSMAFTLILLSWTVITGFAGQVSLAQFALAGFGAWAAGEMVDNYHIPFLLALVMGGLCTLPVGLLTALPALRTRGVNLAIITLGLAVAIYNVLLVNPEWTGGLVGIRIGDPKIFGLDVNAVTHPNRYADVVLVCLVLSGVAVANLRRGVTGRRMIAVRSNERAAASLGIGVPGAKLFAFGLGAVLAGLGGVLLTFTSSQLTLSGFDPISGVNLAVDSVLGGLGYVTGALIGSQLAPGGIGGQFVDLFGHFNLWVATFGGLALLFIVVQNPDGIAAKFDSRPKGEEERTRESKGRVWQSLKSGQLLNRRRKLEIFELPPTQKVTVLPMQLAVSNVTVRFGGVVALSDVSFEITPGEIVGLIGPNGAGKSTAIDAVTGFVACEGTLRLDGELINGWTAARRARAGIGRSFQSLELFDDMTILENIRTACDPRRVSGT